MRLTSHRLDALPDDPSAAALLGHDHPLVRAVDRFSLLVQRSLIVAALLSTSIVALIEGVSSALSLVVAAAVVLTGFVCGGWLPGPSGSVRSISSSTGVVTSRSP